MRIVFDLQKFANINNSATDTVISGTDDNDKISNTGNFVTIQAGTGNDYIDNEVNGSQSGGAFVKIYGGEGDDTIDSDGSYATLDGGDGNDHIHAWGEVTITGGCGNDTLRLGDDNRSGHNSLIQYSYGDGYDVITNFSSNDTLKIVSTKKFTSLSSGSDMFINFDNGSIILKNIGNNVTDSNFVTVKGGSTKLPTGLSYNDDNTIITASKKFKKSSFSFADYSDVIKFDGTKITRAVKITGNSLDNEIQGGSKNDTILGGAGNDTLIGGAGNDVLTGGKGSDIFVYSKGNDVIKDYTEGSDIIRLQDATIKSWKTSGKNVIFTTTKGKITVRNGKGKAITITETKIYSNSSSQTAGLFAENNFVTNDNLSEIVKNNLTPTALEKISSTNFENFTQENNLITYSEK